MGIESIVRVVELCDVDSVGAGGLAPEEGASLRVRSTGDVSVVSTIGDDGPALLDSSTGAGG